MKSPLFDNVVEGVEVIGESRRSGGCRHVTSIDINTICDLIEDWSVTEPTSDRVSGSRDYAPLFVAEMVFLIS